MSREGIEKISAVFSTMQKAREELIRMGSQCLSTAEGKQDILLGQLLRKAEHAVKDEFMEIIAMKGKP